MKDPLSLIEDKTLANEVHQVRCHKKFTAVKCRACARGSILVGRAPISRAKFKGRHKKKSLSPKISEGKLKRSQRSVKETKVVKRKTQDKAYSSIWR